MAENVLTISTDDLFSLGAKFNTSESVENEVNELDEVMAGDGDYACSHEYDARTDYRQVAAYCGGAAPDIETDLGALLSTFGAVANSKLPTGLSIAFEAGKAAVVTVEGHQHTANPHTTGLATFDVTGIIPASSGLGVPSLITVDGSVNPVSATVDIAMTHHDGLAADGTHGTTGQHTCRVDLSVQYEGHPSGVTAGNWLDVKIEKTKTNDGLPVATLTAHQYVDKA